MTITGIDVSQIDTALYAERLGETEATTATEGWLRCDAAGQLWVRTTRGECKLFRAGWGGMETNRWPVWSLGNATAHKLPTAIGCGIMQYFHASDGSNYSAVGWRVQDVQAHAGLAIFGLTQDTVASLGFPRVILRGGMVTRTTTIGTTGLPDIFAQPTAAGSTAVLNNAIPFNSVSVNDWHGPAMRHWASSDPMDNFAGTATRRRLCYSLGTVFSGQ